MLKTYLYIPEQLEERVAYTAKTLKKSKAEIMRQAIERGINSIQHQGTTSAQAMTEIAAIGRKHKLQGPKDSSERMDDYLWGKEWSKDE